jgi:LysM repeat protein
VPVSRSRLSRAAAHCTIVLGLVLATPLTASAGKPACQYTVKKGDTLSRIAVRNGVTEANLIKANAALAKNPNRLRVGQTIELCRAKRLQASRPEKCGDGGAIARHKVGKGETLGAIAARYSVSRASIRKANPRLKTRPNDMIRVGETLRVCTTNRRQTHRAWLVDGVALQPGEGYHLRRPANAWGTPAATAGIQAAIARYRELEPDAPVVQIGDISRKNGGPLRSHLSHQDGRDVDIGYVFEQHDEGKSRRIDIPRTWSLISSFVEDEHLAVIFVDYRLQRRLYEHAQSIGVDQARLDEVFEYPRKGDGEALLYHWRGHTIHFHVRFKPTPTKIRPPDQS